MGGEAAGCPRVDSVCVCRAGFELEPTNPSPKVLVARELWEGKAYINGDDAGHAVRRCLLLRAAAAPGPVVLHGDNVLMIILHKIFHRDASPEPASRAGLSARGVQRGQALRSPTLRVRASVPVSRAYRARAQRPMRTLYRAGALPSTRLTVSAAR